jgi:hypothetical protein
MNPNQIQQSVPPNYPSYDPNLKLPKNHHPALVWAIISTLLLVSALIFGVWAFVGMVNNKSNLDAKIEKASVVAVEKAEIAKDAEFTEREKSPYKTFSGSLIAGSLKFEYGKSWSIYKDEKDSGTVLDFYAHPDFVSGVGETKTAQAFRAQVLDTDYTTELKKYEAKIKSGKVLSTAYTLKRMPDQLGTKLTGELEKDKQRILILMPLRDKTLVFWTDITDYYSEFDRIVESVTFVP